MRKKTLIAAMPWTSYYMPSIQLAALKSYLQNHGSPCEAAHWFIEIAHAISFDDYDNIAQPFPEYGESLYAYLYFPEMRQKILSDEWLIDNCQRVTTSRKETSTARIPFSWTETFFAAFERLHQDILDRTDWNEYALVGLTLNYGQNLASLYMAREIKKRNPEIKIILGGSEASRELGESLLAHFEEIDFACNGEGEIPLLNLVRALENDVDAAEISKIKGIVGRRKDGTLFRNAPDQLPSLSGLPIPNFDEYFEAIERMPGLCAHDIVTSLPVESSRGCYYACNFCALNLQWENFRGQDPENMANTLRELAQEHGILDFFFMDNITPKNINAIFSRILEDNLDYRFFYEVRANLPRSTVDLMTKAGLTRVQIGIESLSTSLLKKFNKKSKAIHNLRAMKNYEELGVRATSNLIIDYPLSTEDEVAETLKNMDFILHCRPPANLSEFSLQVGAPDYHNPAERGLEILGNQSEYARFYPQPLFHSLNMLRKNHRPLGKLADWGPVAAKLKAWEERYQAHIKNWGEKIPQLAYYDGGTFLKIEDRRGDALEIIYLNDWERKAYLLADQIVTDSDLREEFPEVPAEEIRQLLEFCVANKIMFEEDGLYLSLALSTRPGRQMVLSSQKKLPVIPETTGAQNTAFLSVAK